MGKKVTLDFLPWGLLLLTETTGLRGRARLTVSMYNGLPREVWARR